MAVTKTTGILEVTGSFLSSEEYHPGHHRHNDIDEDNVG
jgi:hypothetical protein